MADSPSVRFELGRYLIVSMRGLAPAFFYFPRKDMPSADSLDPFGR